MKSIAAKEFQKKLTPAIKQQLLAHFNTLYPCETLSAYEYKIVYAAYLKKMDKLPPQNDFYLAPDLISFEIEADDNQPSANDNIEEEELPEAVLLALMNDSYDLDKIIEIIS